MSGRANRSLLGAGAALLSVALVACSTARPVSPVSPAPPAVLRRTRSSIVGVASWYGPGFDGRRTATGEVYSQEELTAASTVISLGSLVMVTNLQNGRAVEVRINDHGPYVKDRTIDLSHGAAAMLGIVEPGTAPVRIDMLSQPAGTRSLGTPLRYYVQVGSFSQPGNARASGAGSRRTTATSASTGSSRERESFYRVRMGAFGSRGAARERANETARLGYPIVIVSE